MDLHKLEMETLFAEVFNLVKLTDREDHSENDECKIWNTGNEIVTV